MPTSTTVKGLNINELTEAQYDTAVQGGVIGPNELSVLTDVSYVEPSDLATVATTGDYDDLINKPTIPAAIQVSSMPVASQDEEGNIYQFVGTTDASYTNGYFYECVSDGGNPATYSWTRVDVQPAGSSLPSQTGHSGEFLTTDGTDASWAAISALQNTATGTDSLTLLGTGTTTQRSINIGVGSSIDSNNNVAIGHQATIGASTYSNVIVGMGAHVLTNKSYNIAIGSSSYASSGSEYGVAIGANTATAAKGAIQIGNATGVQKTNSDANTLKVGNANGNFEIMSADGTIPTARLTKVNSTITLTAAGWSGGSQSVTVTGMTATGVVLVSPDPTDQAAYTSAGILCTAQAANSLTFTCSTTPSADIDVNVVCL